MFIVLAERVNLHNAHWMYYFKSNWNVYVPHNPHDKIPLKKGILIHEKIEKKYLKNERRN